jgi:hypothetical protein
VESEYQYNVLLQGLFFNVLVGKNFCNAFVKVLGKCWNSVCGMVVLINVSSFTFFMHSVTCMQMPGSSILGSVLFYQTIQITGSKNRVGAA